MSLKSKNEITCLKKMVQKQYINLYSTTVNNSWIFESLFIIYFENTDYGTVCPGKMNRLHNNLNIFLPCFGLSHCTRAYTAIGDPARQPGIQDASLYRGTGTVLYGRGQLDESTT